MTNGKSVGVRGKRRAAPHVLFMRREIAIATAASSEVGKHSSSLREALPAPSLPPTSRIKARRRRRKCGTLCLERLIYACAMPLAPPPWVPAATPPNNRVPGLRIVRNRRVKDAPEVVTTMAVVPLVDRARRGTGASMTDNACKLEKSRPAGTISPAGST